MRDEEDNLIRMLNRLPREGRRISLGLHVENGEVETKSNEMTRAEPIAMRCVGMASSLLGERDELSVSEIMKWFGDRRELARQKLSSLGIRERQIVLLVGHGYPNKQCASILGVSEKTIEKYRGLAGKKLGLNSGAEFAQLIAAADLLAESNGTDRADSRDQNAVGM
jgi:DNA-binding CsgD family transcriptional regulator